MPSAVRIVLVDVGPALRAAVHAACTDSDLLVVGDVTGEIESLMRVGRGGVDVVIVEMARGLLPPIAERLVDESPDVGVLAVDGDRGEALLYRLWPRVDHVGHVATDGLGAVIRRPARRVA